MTSGGGNRLCLGGPRPHIPVTLAVIDTTPKLHLGERAIRKALEVASYDEVKFLTTDMTREHAVKIRPINGIEDYSIFVVRELHRYFDTSHVLLCQYDGYPLNSAGWRPDFLNWDFLGAPWLQWNSVGNGGFSLRSKRLCELLSGFVTNETPHPEDSWITHRHRPALERVGVKFAPVDLAKQFAFEGRSWNGKGWESFPKNWTGQFGFHSWLTPLPATMDKPLIFHHSGDIGDVLYSLATVKAMGGGMFFLSQDCRFPFPHAPRMCLDQRVEKETANIAPLLEAQDYIWHCSFTHGLPFSTDVDFNSFREFYQTRNQDNFANLLQLQAKRFNIKIDESEPWLTVPKKSDKSDRSIIVNRTQRFQNVYFPWHKLVQDYGHLMAFVGSEQEHGIFQGFAGPRHKEIPWIKTQNCLELAQVIDQAKVCIMNQSTPLAIALGLGKNCVVELWPANPNVVLQRSNVYYWNEKYGEIRLPESWLR